MIIVEKNVGEKIPYTVNTKKTSICFDDDLTINLSKREKDWAEHIDVCFDRDGDLVIGAAVGRYYVAEIDIPARRYEIIIHESTETEDEEGDTPSEERVPLPLDMDTVTLSLWAIEEG